MSAKVSYAVIRAALRSSIAEVREAASFMGGGLWQEVQVVLWVSAGRAQTLESGWTVISKWQGRPCLFLLYYRLCKDRESSVCVFWCRKCVIFPQATANLNFVCQEEVNKMDPCMSVRKERSKLRALHGGTEHPD